MPMGMADAATALFTRHLKFDPADPHWPDRDRFVLSAGHGSMLIYALLYLTGYARPTIEDISNFRQLGSPLRRPSGEFRACRESRPPPARSGRALAMAVGMAIAERHLNAVYGDELVDHRTWVIAGDGCLMEGVNHEAVGLAGHLKLGRLIVLWDDNKHHHRRLDRPVAQRGRLARHAALRLAHDRMRRARCRRRSPRDRRSQRRSAPVAGPLQDDHRLGRARTSRARRRRTARALGADEVAAAREELGWDRPPFVIPDDIADAWRAGRRARGRRHAPNGSGRLERERPEGRIPGADGRQGRR